MTKVKCYMGNRGLILILVAFIGVLIKIYYEGYSILNILFLIVGTIFLAYGLFHSFFPFLEYDENGFTSFVIFKTSKKYSWSEVTEVFSKKEMNSTYVILPDGFAWIIDSKDRNNYYDTLRDILKYIPEEKFDELTLKRAKGPKKRYFI